MIFLVMAHNLWVFTVDIAVKDSCNRFDGPRTCSLAHLPVVVSIYQTKSQRIKVFLTDSLLLCFPS